MELFLINPVQSFHYREVCVAGQSRPGELASRLSDVKKVPGK
jgi:hypothetical protein